MHPEQPNTNLKLEDHQVYAQHVPKKRELFKLNVITIIRQVYWEIRLVSVQQLGCIFQITKIFIATSH